MKRFTLGIDIGGTKCAVVLGGTQIPQAAGQNFILDKQVFPTQTQLGPEYTIGRMYEAIDLLLERTG